MLMVFLPCVASISVPSSLPFCTILFAGALCFIPVPKAPLAAQMIIFVAGYIIWDAFYTIANVPYGSLLGLISDKAGDRAALSAFRSVGSLVAQMATMALIPFIIYDDNDNIIGERVFIIAIVMGVIGFAALQFMIKNTTIRCDEHIKSNQEQQGFNVKKAAGNFFKNRAAVGVTIAAMGMFLGMQGAATSVNVMFQSYFENAKISGLVSVFALIPIICFTPFARKMVVKYGKKELAAVGSLFSLAACVLMLVLPITPDFAGMVIYIICQLVNSLGMGVFSTVSWAMMGDAIDYSEWKYGIREEGTVYALHSFFRKLAQGIGPALALVVMYALGYIGKNGADQTIEVATNMRYLVAALYTLSAVLQFIGLALVYNIDKKTLTVMNKELGRTVEADDRPGSSADEG